MYMYDQKSIHDVLHHTSDLCSYDTLVSRFINFIYTYMYLPTNIYMYMMLYSYSQDPYFMKNHLGQYECKLCLTLHNTEVMYNI